VALAHFADLAAMSARTLAASLDDLDVDGVA
jgi:hypothetical protein